jgi:hypothetical protein
MLNNSDGTSNYPLAALIFGFLGIILVIVFSVVVYYLKVRGAMYIVDNNKKQQ